MSSEDMKFLRLAIEKAKESVAQGGFPAGAIIVKNGRVISGGISIGNKLTDPTSHGEMIAIREACKSLQSSDLTNVVLYASMQPCLMCLGASMWSMIPKIVFACSQDKVSPEYYGGDYNANNINAKFIRQIELVHLVELEDESLTVIHQWEETITKGR